MFQEVDNLALAAKSGEESAIGDVVDSIFAQNGIVQLDPNLVASLKDRIVRAELSGQTVSETQVVQATNWLMNQMSAPAYAQTSLLQTRALRLGLISVMPNLFVDKDVNGNVGQNKSLGSQPSANISPTQALALSLLIIQQKLLNPAFQKEPAQWDADYIAKTTQASGTTQETGNSGPELRERETSPQTTEMRHLVFGTSRSAVDWANMAQGALDQLGIPR